MLIDLLLISFHIYMIYALCRVLLGRSSSLYFNTSIGYRGNGEAYTTPTRTLFVRLTLFVYDPYTYPAIVTDYGYRFLSF